MDVQNIIKKVLIKIRPTNAEEESIKEFIRSLHRIAKTVSGQEVVVCGSIGKQTWLKGNHDIDMFLLFPKNTTRGDLEKKGLEAGKKIAKEVKGKAKIKYAEHPYTQIRAKGFDIDVVPAYRIGKGEKIISAVDRSPLHLEYVLNHMAPKMRDEARLLKQFCKGICVYGSDAKNLGFSGYICELLVLRYGTFLETLKAASKWSPGEVVDLDIFMNLDKRKFRDQPLIVIDPTDRERNAAAVVNAENFFLFVKSAKGFLDKPKEKYFWPQERPLLRKKDIRRIKTRGTKFIALVMKKPDVIDDVLYPQLRKTSRRLESMLRYNEFSVMRSAEIVSGNKIMFVLEMESWSLPIVNQMLGPPVFATKNSKDFLTKYQNISRGGGFGPYLEENRWAVDAPRKFTTAISLLADFKKKSRKDLKEEGIPSYIADVMPQMQILEDDKFWKLVAKNKELSKTMREVYVGHY